MNKLQAITKGSRIIDEIFWELLKTLSARGGSQPKADQPPAGAKASGGKTNLTELSLARRIRQLAKAKGADGLAFPSIVSFGRHAAEIHHSPTSNKIGKNNFLMLDYGVKVQGYCSDFTRTLFLGTPNKFHEKIYNIVLKAQLAALKKVKIGADCVDVDLTARNIIASAGLARHYNHSTGHAVGRKIHEQPGFTPTSKFQIPNSVVMTVEPGIYLPKKFGVRIEDMILVSTKPKVFSKVPKDFKSMIVK